GSWRSAWWAWSEWWPSGCSSRTSDLLWVVDGGDPVGVGSTAADRGPGGRGRHHRAQHPSLPGEGAPPDARQAGSLRALRTRAPPPAPTGPPAPRPRVHLRDDRRALRGRAPRDVVDGTARTGERCGRAPDGQGAQAVLPLGRGGARGLRHAGAARRAGGGDRPRRWTRVHG